MLTGSPPWASAAGEGIATTARAARSNDCRWRMTERVIDAMAEPLRLLALSRTTGLLAGRHGILRRSLQCFFDEFVAVRLLQRDALELRVELRKPSPLLLGAVDRHPSVAREHG